MKKIMNSPAAIVQEMCGGISLAFPELKFDPKYQFLYRKDLQKDKVSLISGGGSGHEPAHAGFIGKGMLDAAVCGDIFASPSQVQIYHALLKTASEKGTLMIVKNYSGDVMNFKNAALLAENEVNVDYVIVNDDIAVKDSLYTVGRRGVAGTVLVHKIAGAAAERGDTLAEVKEAAQEAIANLRSIGFALSSCTVPAKGTPTFTLAEDEMEYGIGIHGEPGVKRQKIVTADELSQQMIPELLEDLSACAGDEVALLINGFGGTPLQELYVLNYSVCKLLLERKMRIFRVFVGNFMTSIDMMGASLSLLKMTPKLRTLLDAPCNAPAFRLARKATPITTLPQLMQTAKAPASYGMLVEEKMAKLSGNVLSKENIIYLVDRMGTFIIQNEVPFCELDAHAGDGDFGMSIAKGFRSLKEEWEDILQKDSGDIGSFLTACAFVIMEHCGGASGPIWGSAFLAAGRQTKGKQVLSRAEFALMLQAAVEGIQKTGKCSFGRGAVVGDKTLIDALVPCVDYWSASSEENLLQNFRKGAEAAVQGAKSTENIVARMGRAGAVGKRSIGYPDAGAYAIGRIFTELSEYLHE